jgi:hypothetical protein
MASADQDVQKNPVHVIGIMLAGVETGKSRSWSLHARMIGNILIISWRVPRTMEIIQTSEKPEFSITFFFRVFNNKFRYFYYFLFLYCASVLIIAETARLKKQEHIVMNDNSVSSAGILMRKEQMAIIALAVLLTLIAVFMLLAKSVNLEIFFVLSLIGFFIIVELITPKYIRPGYLRYIQYILLAGIVIIGVIFALKLMEILGLEIVFL